MLTTSKKPQKPSLIDVKSLQEAITVLNARRAPAIYTKTISTIFKADMTNPASKTWINQQLRETENTLKKDEEEKEVTEKKLMGYQTNLQEMGNHNNMKETEGNPSSGPEPTPENIANKTGVSAQNDGSSLDDIHDTNPPIKPAELGAHEQPGVSQLKEAIQKVYNIGSGVDPLNQSVINGMANGMTQVEATNAASADNHMMEAVFNKMAAKILVPIFNAQATQVDSLNETIRVYDQKLEAVRKENKGLSEAVQISPHQTIIPVQTEPQNPQADSQSLEDHRAEISKKLKESSMYN